VINQLGLFWGKTDKEGNWNPLMLHLIDVASTAEAILYREPFYNAPAHGRNIGFRMGSS